MKIIFLNIWQGEIWKSLKKFIRDQASDTDFFCFQEVPLQMKPVFENLLPKHKGVFGYKKLDVTIDYGQAIFLRKDFSVKSSGKLLTKQEDLGILLYAQAIIPGGEIMLCNVHGVPLPGDKLDSPARLNQSESIVNFLSKIDGPKIIGGDFNLLPETKSIKILEEAGYVNLIKDFKVSTTRNRLSWGMFKKEERQYFADYVFISEDVKVKSFSVPNVEISDHLPQILEFEI